MREFIKSKYGKLILSVLFGFGLATLFRKTCKDKECMKFTGPSLSEIQNQTYQYDKKCYKFNSKIVECNPNKKIVEFA
jgi:hypothetical protein